MTDAALDFAAGASTEPLLPLDPEDEDAAAGAAAPDGLEALDDLPVASTGFDFFSVADFFEVEAGAGILLALEAEAAADAGTAPAPAAVCFASTAVTCLAAAADGAVAGRCVCGAAALPAAGVAVFTWLDIGFRAAFLDADGGTAAAAALRPAEETTGSLSLRSFLTEAAATGTDALAAVLTAMSPCEDLAAGVAAGTDFSAEDGAAVVRCDD